LKLTVGRYYTPSGRSIQAYGIIPDIEIEDFSAEVLENARVKQEVRREKDMRGHLTGDAEDDDSASGPSAAVKGAKRDAKDKHKDEFKKVQYWWTESDSKSTKALTPKDKLLKDDYQVQQAYSYLRAWNVIEGQRASVDATIHANGAEAPNAKETPVKSEDGAKAVVTPAPKEIPAAAKPEAVKPEAAPKKAPKKSKSADKTAAPEKSAAPEKKK
jgi:hypothetical protein